MVFNTLTFPGLLPGGRSIMGQLSSTAVWEGSFALWLWGVVLLLAPLVRWPGTKSRVAANFGWAVVFWLLSISLLNFLFVTSEEHLPLGAVLHLLMFKA